ncbi:hypothetical protein [Klebsiella africana]|uniref:hypothetical protein n=1 Tax=Klebsiella africana TaxID=2489010 RepID=UPI001932FC52|nr:hypothetical protein [Klebsiella africana]QRF11456.1 hypothetical protein H1X61_18760 [Klebsiella africana]
MSDLASGDKLILETLVSDGGLKIFICDFDRGWAILSDAIKGKQFEYIIQGERDAGYINLVRDNTIELTLYAVNLYARGNCDSDKSSPVFCALCEDQILIIECKRNSIRKPLRVDELIFEY